jgi:hypothetical protein
LVLSTLGKMDELFSLRTKPTQFTKGKTGDTLFDLTKRYLLHADTLEEHVIDIIVTNKSLQETQQWKIRTLKTFENYENIKIHILSSKSDDYKSIDKYITDILLCESKNDLPNILIICYHEKRVCDDLIRLFTAFCGKNCNRSSISYKFHISFDEVDANLGVTKTFLKKIKKFINTDVIIGILFITATPDINFWKMLKKNGIPKLLNINSNNTQDFNKELENYRSFDDHDIHTHNFDTNNPLDYIKDIFDNTTLIDSSDIQKIIFAPAHTYTKASGIGSHAEFVVYFIRKNYCVLLLNGTFKGFIYPGGVAITIQQFNIDYNIDGELRESLSKWKEVNPTINLLITGNNIIERGLTFNTCGFNFTHMILSNYHLSSISKLIQMAGRSTGGILYVDIITIICPELVKNTIIDFNKKLVQICSLNPTYFNQTDFEIDNNKTIPVKLTINCEETLQSLIYACDVSSRNMIQIHTILLNGITIGKITLDDRNNIKHFDITKRSLKRIGMYQRGHKTEASRLWHHNTHYENFTTTGQTGNENSYAIDFAKYEYIHKGYTHPSNVIWVTYRC